MFSLLPSHWMVFLAQMFARFAHGSILHKRSWVNIPYWHHLEEVADLVKSVDGTPEQIAAAWLHDTVEDTWVRQWMIRLLFGFLVSYYVMEMTEIQKEGNRAQRKLEECIRLGKCPAEVQTIKLADLLSNGRWIFKHYRYTVKKSRLKRHRKRFDVIYYNEAKALLGHLVKGDLSLNTMLRQEIEDFERYLETLQGDSAHE